MRAAESFALNEFTWHESGLVSHATGRVFYDDDALYIYFDVTNYVIHADVTERADVRGQLCGILRTAPETSEKYLNFKADYCGQFKLA